MKEPHLLRAAGNPRRLIENLKHLLSPTSMQAVEADLEANVRDLYDLGREHWRFARRLSGGSWRHAVSRLYYSSYSAWRAIRLCVDGHYSQETKDHKRISQFPEDFPSRDMYAVRLPLLRDDRNLCDYDHTAVLDDLIETPDGWGLFVREFLDDTKRYLTGRGVSV